MTGVQTCALPICVKEIVVSSEYDNCEVLRIIASVESLSNHPIAGAIVKYALSGKTDIIKPENVKEIAGHGLIADVEGKRCFVGNSKLMKQEDIIYPAAIDDIEDTVVILAVGYRFAGYITLSDIVKDDAADAVKDLADHDIHNIYILSGDKHSIVSGLAESLKIKNYKGDLLPHDKMKEVEMLKENRDNRVAFVGDGINDAPVLALSDVGIAMGGLGSDAAIETADVVIQTDQPSTVALAVRIGKLTKRIIFQNITLAFGVKIFVLLLGFFGYASLWEAVFADVGVSLIAVLNAMRIQRMV